VSMCLRQSDVRVNLIGHLLSVDPRLTLGLNLAGHCLLIDPMFDSASSV
jgi:hypothetical protein